MNSNNIILLHAALGSREQLKAIEIELSEPYFRAAKDRLELSQ